MRQHLTFMLNQEAQQLVFLRRKFHVLTADLDDPPHRVAAASSRQTHSGGSNWLAAPTSTTADSGARRPAHKSTERVADGNVSSFPAPFLARAYVGKLLAPN
jgi:hypothetical protein